MLEALEFDRLDAVCTHITIANVSLTYCSLFYPKKELFGDPQFVTITLNCKIHLWNP